MSNLKFTEVFRMMNDVYTQGNDNDEQYQAEHFKKLTPKDPFPSDISVKHIAYFIYPISKRFISCFQAVQSLFREGKGEGLF